MDLDSEKINREKYGQQVIVLGYDFASFIFHR